MCTEWHTLSHCAACRKTVREHVKAEICSNRRPNGVYGECPTGPMTKWRHNYDAECADCKKKREDEIKRRLAAIQEEEMK